MNAHYLLLGLSRVDEREVFKVILEYWSKLCEELYEELSQQPIILLPFKDGLNSKRRKMYDDILEKLRVVMVERMVKPEEVLIVENDEGEIVREQYKESDTITLYKSYPSFF